MTPYFFQADAQAHQPVPGGGADGPGVFPGPVYAPAVPDQMAARIEEVYDNLEVRCSVTNLTGTQSDQLNLPDWVLRLFDGGKDLRQFPGQRPVRPLCPGCAGAVHGVLHHPRRPGPADPQRRHRVEGGQLPAGLLGLHRHLAGGLRRGYVPRAGLLLLLPEEQAHLVDGDGYVTLEFTGVEGDNIQHRFLAAGTYTGGSGRLYCSWWVAAAV